jgi:metal-sulfur cluster biosynthetic enzyme
MVQYGAKNGAEVAVVTRDQIIEVLKTCFDPEIPVNIWDLGLIYDITIAGDVVQIKMTLTAVGCSLGPQLVSEIQSKMLGVDGVEDCKVDMVWSPPWTPERLSDDGRLSLQAMGFPV